MLTLDSETCGLHGMVVLLQYAYDDGPIQLYCPWEHPVSRTLGLIDEFTKHDLCGFNLSFDWFHLCKLYTCFRLLPQNKAPNPEDVAEVEMEARDGPCIKPQSACDIMLWARKTHYQSLMDRKDVRIRKVPKALAGPLAEELEKRIQLNPIYFGRRKKKDVPQWQVFDREEDEEFKDVVMKFAPTTALKALAVDALGLKNVAVYDDIDLGRDYWPEELGYAPFAKALPNSKRTWPYLIRAHIEHWTTNEPARKYAANDVDYTRRLYKYFGSPDFGDDDSELACMVAACRWRGYAINIEGIKKLKADAEVKAVQAPTATREVRQYLGQFLSPTELECSDMEAEGSTSRKILEDMKKNLRQLCPKCNGQKQAKFKQATKFVQGIIDDRVAVKTKALGVCDYCKGEGTVPHQVCEKAKAVLESRQAALEVNMYEKLLTAGRFHADFKIIGTLSSRMSGAGGLNAQGINSAKRVRRHFTLARRPDVLCGGDFSSFEIVLAIAAWKSKTLEEVVLSYRDCHKCDGTGQSLVCPRCKGIAFVEVEDENGEVKGFPCDYCKRTGKMPTKVACYNCKGKGQVKTKIHALFGTYLYPGWTYEQILDSDGSDDDRYTMSKSMLFALMYGAEAYTLANRGRLDEEDAEAGYQRFIKDFPDVAAARKEIFDKFLVMKQHGGIGSQITMGEPEDYIEESVTGHRRYFTLENKIRGVLFQLANRPPKPWLALKIKTQRRDRLQTISGAVQSALFACAFQMQSGICRAAANHTIQAAGAKTTKNVQRRIWDIQPSGVHEWRVQPMQIHDELQCPTHPDFVSTVSRVVKEAVESFKDRVPLLAIEWFEDIPNWAGKKG